MNHKSTILAIFTATGLTACGGASSKTDAAGTTTSNGTTRTATGAVEATSVGELGLSGALAISLPDALKDSSTGLHLTGSKSVEACLMRSSAKQLVTQIEAASSLLCHIEAEGSNIPWNKAVILDMGSATALLDVPTPPDGSTPPTGAPDGSTPPTGAPGGDSGEMPSMPKIGIYADDSDGDNVAVYICQGDSEDEMELVQSFKVTGAKSITKGGVTVHASKGLINMAMGDATMGGIKGAIAYDSNYTASDTSALKMEMKFSFTGFSFGQKFELNSTDAGLTKVAISEKGTMDFGGGDPFTFKNAGVGLFNAEQGNVLYTYDGSSNQFSTQACVDKDSYQVDCSGTDFASGGELHLTAADVPAVLPESFTPSVPAGFDCAKATWTTITLSTDDATQAKHQACDANLMAGAAEGASGMGDCFSGDFAQGSVDEDIVFEEATPGDFELLGAKH